MSGIINLIFIAHHELAMKAFGLMSFGSAHTMAERCESGQASYVLYSQWIYFLVILLG